MIINKYFFLNQHNYNNAVFLLGRFPSVSVLAEGRQLRISNAQLTDTANYRCIANNKAGSDYLDFELEVQGKNKNFSTLENMCP